MPTVDLAQAKRLLRRPELSIAAVAAELGCGVSTLHKHFTAHAGQSPRAWRQNQGIATADGVSPLVSFRLPEHADLEDAAKEADLTPGTWARNAVQAALRRAKK